MERLTRSPVAVPAVMELATLSRSGWLGLIVGLLVLACRTAACSSPVRC